MPHSPVRILILDDCDIIADTICKIINQSGYRARAVYRHADAISAAHDFEPDVFLTGFVNDCEINGCQTAAEVLTFLPQCHIWIFSGTAAACPVLEEYRRRGYNFGVLAKPLHPMDMLEIMRSYGEPVFPPGAARPLIASPVIAPLAIAPRKFHKFRSLFRRSTR
jgi:DNA-binding NtrC family response regulator